MNFEILVHFPSKGFELNQIVKSCDPFVYLLFRKPKTLFLKPSDKIKKVYLNPPGY